MADEPPATTRLAPQMTDAEALMWSVEKDPWFASTIGTVLICETPIDADRFRHRITAAVADLPRLRERVLPRLGRLAPPIWRTDPEFELGYHLREIALAPPGNRRQLLELATRLLQDPFDRTRPLWQFWIVDGVAGGPGGNGGLGGDRRSAVVIKLHHTITDGQGGVKLAARYMDLNADGPPHSADAHADAPIDLDKIIAEAVAGEAGEDRSTLDPLGLGASAALTAGHGARRQLGMARRLAAETALTMADPARVPELLERIGGDLRTVLGQLAPGDNQARSPLWRQRSRKRRLEVLSLPFGPAKAAAETLGGSLNDFFVTGAVSGVARYHQAHQTPLDELTITFIISTRTGRSEGGNAFTPSKAVVPAGDLAPAARFDAVRDVLGSRRREVSGDGMLGGLAGLAGLVNVLPTSVATRVARAQASAVDFATSNVRAAPFDVYVGGARVLASYPVGPVAGTAWNVTVMSYAGRLHLGIHVDPAAVPDVGLLVTSLAEGYEELFAAGGAPTEVSTIDW